MGKGIFFVQRFWNLYKFSENVEMFSGISVYNLEKYPDIFTNILLEDNFLLHYLFYMSLVNS